MLARLLVKKYCYVRAVLKRLSTEENHFITTLLPECPWQIVGTDLFELDGSHYILVMDYFSRYLKVTKLISTLSSNVINTLKVAFSGHGIPKIVRSDSGPQYS